ncbi:growth hormone secretagogue receptor type 1-like [Branchiostoma floridae]|nr:growth hormone secretagogue receptor type 1-like [Branchiostoma floridae]
MSTRSYNNSTSPHNSSELVYEFVSCAENGSLYLPNCQGMMLDGREDYLSEGALIAVTVVYAVVFLVGVLGNVAVGLAVWGRRELRKATNYFLVNLSVADLLLLLVCMPTSLLETWVPMPWLLGEVMCKLVPYLEVVVCQASVLTIVAVSIERYLGLTHPLRARSVCTSSRTWRAVILLWVTSLLAGSPVLSIAELTTYYQNDTAITVCDTKVDKPWKTAYVLTTTVLFFIVPILLLCVLYSIIGRKMVGTCRLNSEEASDSLVERQRSRRRVVYMMVTVVVVFFVSLLPQRVVQLWLILAPREDINAFGQHDVLILVVFLRIMLYLNSTLNPIIYTLFSTQFRSAFLRLVGFKDKSASLQRTTNTRCWLVRYRNTLEIHGKGVHRTKAEPGFINRQAYPMLPIIKSTGVAANQGVGRITRQVTSTPSPLSLHVRGNSIVSMVPTIHFSDSDQDMEVPPKDEVVQIYGLQPDALLKPFSETSRLTNSTSLRDVYGDSVVGDNGLDTNTPMSKSF